MGKWGKSDHMIYLDNAATTRVSESVAQTIYNTLTVQYANPSSL